MNGIFLELRVWLFPFLWIRCHCFILSLSPATCSETQQCDTCLVLDEWSLKNSRYHKQSETFELDWAYVDKFSTNSKKSFLLKLMNQIPLNHVYFSVFKNQLLKVLSVKNSIWNRRIFFWKRSFPGSQLNARNVAFILIFYTLKSTLVSFHIWNAKSFMKDSIYNTLRKSRHFLLQKERPRRKKNKKKKKTNTPAGFYCFFIVWMQSN